MKLTDDQINTLFNIADRKREQAQFNIDRGCTTSRSFVSHKDFPARRVMVESIIEGYQALEPALAVRWIPAANRRPTDADFKSQGYVFLLRPDGSVVGCSEESDQFNNPKSYWMSVESFKLLPKEPISEEVIQESEFSTWWKAQTTTTLVNDVRSIACAAWKAARNK